MKKILMVLVMLILVLSLVSCDDPEGTKDDDDTSKINTSLVDDIAGEIKDVFESE